MIYRKAVESRVGLDHCSEEAQAGIMPGRGKQAVPLKKKYFKNS